MTSNSLWERIARSLPVKVQDRVAESIRLAGLREDSAEWISKTLLYAMGAALAGGIVAFFLLPWINEWLNNLVKGLHLSIPLGIFIGFVTAGLLGIALRFLSLYYALDRRRAKVDDILPDFLLLVAGNIRAGMTSFSAFKSSSRPEFGPLSEEIKSVTTRSLGTDSFGSALSTVSERIQSKSLTESVQFFLQAIRSGGKIAQLLENTANDLRRTQELKKELETSTRTYVIFVAFVMMIATPLLMAVSVEFVQLITRIQAQNTFLSSASSTSIGFLGGSISITAPFLESVAYILLLGNAILAGIFMGVIGQGKPWVGLRYTPLLFAISMVGFFIAKTILGGVLGTS